MERKRYKIIYQPLPNAATGMFKPRLYKTRLRYTAVAAFIENVALGQA